MGRDCLGQTLKNKDQKTLKEPRKTQNKLLGLNQDMVCVWPVLHYLCITEKTKSKQLSEIHLIELNTHYSAVVVRRHK